MTHTRRWTVDNVEDQIRAANREIHSRLIRIASRRRNLSSQLPIGDSSSILEIVDVLINNAIISREGQSREFAEVIARMGDRIDRGERIAPEEFQSGNYTTAIAGFDSTLQDIEDQFIDTL
jgi:hypothetical protein